MKIVASKRLILWSALPLPFLLFIGVYPSILSVTSGWLLIILLCAGIDVFISHTFPQNIHITLPPRLSIIQNDGKGFTIIVNNSSSRDLSVRIAFEGHPELTFLPGEIQETFAKKGERELTIIIEALYRGEKSIGHICVEAQSFFKFWLIRDKKKARCTVAVYPNIFQDNQHLAASLFLRSDIGIRSQRTIGHGREFEQLRDYLPDDTYTDIAWKATAKRGKLTTRVFQTERTQHIYIAFDHSRASHISYGKRPNLEIALESALLMHLCCDREGDMLGLITFADKITRYCPAGRGRNHFGTMRNMLMDIASRPVTPDFENLFIFIKLHIRRRALILLFTNLEDPGLASLFFNDVSIINRFHLVTLCTFNGYENKLLFSREKASDIPEIYERLGTQIAKNEQDKFASRLKRQNVDMLRFRPERFAVGIIDHYLKVKRRQIL